jgi:N-acetylneuraminic acid mutarotase
VTSVADKTKSDTATVTVTALVADKPPIPQNAAASDVGFTPAVVHNTWSSGAPLQTAVFGPAVGVLKGKIYLVGGYGSDGPTIITQVYDPTKNTWSSGVAMPTPLNEGSAAVVNGILYVIGGSTDGSRSQTSAVYAYSPRTKTWSMKASMLTARQDAGVVVEKNIIYVIGGYNNTSGALNDVESYNPATDTWTEEAPLLISQYGLSGARIGTKIVATDGYEISGGGAAGDTESYAASGNLWTSLTPDPMIRAYACSGTIGTQLYVAGGADNQIVAQTTTESFKPSNDTWATLAAMPQAAFIQGPAVYKGKLYCFGGWAAYQQGAELNNLQIYQP